MDRVTLARIEIEWLVACYHHSARLMPRNVYERLKSLGFVDDGASVTPAGIRWLDEWRTPSGLRRGPKKADVETDD